MNDTSIYGRLEKILGEGKSVALVTVVHSEGSTPREAGAKMLVCADGATEGTVGGGKLELLAIAEAKKALAEGASRKVRFDLTEQGIGMVCNGSAEIFIEVSKQTMSLHSRRRAYAPFRGVIRLNYPDLKSTILDFNCEEAELYFLRAFRTTRRA